MADILYNVMRAKLLTLSGFLMFLCCLCTFVAAILPFWMTLTVKLNIVDDQTTVTRVIDAGIFFMDKNHFINMLLIEKTDSDSMVPLTIRGAQLLYVIGLTGMFVCCATCCILAFRTFASTTGEMCLAAAVVPSALSLTGGVLLMVFGILGGSGSVWHGLPVPDYVPNRYEYVKVLDAYPDLSMNWGTYIGCFAALLAIISAVTMWMQACFTCREYREHRYIMLREGTDHTSPIPGKTPGFINVYA